MRNTIYSILVFLNVQYVLSMENPTNNYDRARVQTVMLNALFNDNTLIETKINKSLDTYLKECSESKRLPTLNIGCGHPSPEQINRLVLSNRGYNLFHRHLDEFTINLETRMSPDICGNVNQGDVLEHLLTHGKNSFYLVWEEGCSAVLPGNITKIYELLKPGGYYVYHYNPKSITINEEDKYNATKSIFEEAFIYNGKTEKVNSHEASSIHPVLCHWMIYNDIIIAKKGKELKSDLEQRREEK